jgi:hypothetical protein
VWNLYLADAPLISHAAVAILSVCGSEAAVERTFSAQGLVHSDLRNRLGDATVEAEMFIKFNQRTVAAAEGEMQQAKRKAKAHRPVDVVAAGHCRELVENFQEGEAPPSVAGLFTRPEVKEAMEDVVDEKAEAAPVVISHVPRPPAADDVQAFIEHIVVEMGVTPRYRWSESRLNQLSAAGQVWRTPIRDTDVVLRNKVMQWVRAQEAQEPAVVEV